MSGKHRRIGSRTKKIATVGVATATVTAMTVGAAPPPPKPKPAPVAVNRNLDLMAAISPFPQPDQIPDLTAGLGTVAYDFSQAVADLVIRAIVENVNLAALAQASGVDLDSLLQGLLGGDLNDLLGGVLGGVLNGIPLDTGDLAEVILGPLDVLPLVEEALAQALGLLGADSVGGLLRLLGIDLSNPLNLANLPVPGVNTITAGPVFTLLKLLGADLGWVPSLPNSVANEINNTEYLPVGVNGLLETVVDLVDDLGPVGNALALILNPIIGSLPNLDVLDLRVPVTIGVGLGAFAAATGYSKVLADLANQPGGINFDGDAPLLGSLTVLPMLLLLNPARPNGGALSRFYPLAELFGINTLNPRTEATSSCDGLCIPVLNTGLELGGANLLPVLVDVGIGYFPANDLAAWPNPVTLANNAMALMLPTYFLRGLDISAADEQVTSQVGDILGGVLAGDPLAINVYLTLMPATLPLLEPLYLAADVVNLATFGALRPNVIERLANALAPALTALTNLGYTDVVRNPDGTYTRTLTEADVPTPFLSFPSGINPLQVPFDVVNLLVKGFQKEFVSGNPTPGTPNAITGLLDLLNGTLPLGGLADLVNGIVGNVLGGLNLSQLATQQLPSAANALPSAKSTMVTLSTDPEGDVSTGKHAAAADAPVPEDTGATPQHAAEETETPTEETTSETTPDSSGEEEEPGSTTTKPKPKAPRNPVGDDVGGAAHTDAEAVGGAAHNVTTGVAGVLKGLAPKKPTTKTPTTKADTDKDTTNSGAASSSETKKDAA
jgi:hypothetical protein